MTRLRVRIFSSALLLAFAGCTVVPAAEQGATTSGEVVQAIPAAVPAPVPTPAPASTNAPMPQPPRATFAYSGELEQGGWIRGRAPSDTVSARLDDTALILDENGYFFAAFDRDAGTDAALVATLTDGRTVRSPLTVRPRAWNLERINAPLRPGGASSEAFMARRKPELDRIWAAREKVTEAQGWRQDFIWPVKGRISGRFGSQRIYQGEPGSFHTGLDIAPGAGTPYVAPADGVVVLAAHDDFSLEGKLLIIDHGQGLNSAFLHSQRLDVREGDRVRQGQQLGLVGASGRVTGPHLHWSIKWHNGPRLDPLLFLPPAP